MSAENKRIEWIDFLKGIGVLLVILGHTTFPLHKLIYGFHMPLFFALSGYLFGNKQITKGMDEKSKVVIQKNVRNYIIPYFVMCGLNLFICLIWEKNLGIYGVIRYIIGIVYSRGSTTWMPNCSPLWFLTCFFVVVTAYHWINKIPKNTVRIIVISCLGLLAYVLDVCSVRKLPWNLDTAMMGLVFFEIGVQIQRKQLVQKINMRFSAMQSTFLMVALFLLGILCICANSAVEFNENMYGNAVLMVTGASCMVFVWILIGVKFYKKNKITDFVIFWGKYSLIVMGFDYFSGKCSNLFWGKLGFLNWFSVFVLKLFILFCGIYIWSILTKRLSALPSKKVMRF